MVFTCFSNTANNTMLHATICRCTKSKASVYSLCFLPAEVFQKVLVFLKVIPFLWLNLDVLAEFVHLFPFRQEQTGSVWSYWCSSPCDDRRRLKGIWNSSQINHMTNILTPKCPFGQFNTHPFPSAHRSHTNGCHTAVQINLQTQNTYTIVSLQW